MEDNQKELWMDLGRCFLYYETEANTIDDALDEFRSKLAKIGCINDNFGYERLELRIWHDDGDYDVIEER